MTSVVQAVGRDGVGLDGIHGAVGEFVRLLPGTPSAAKTTMVEIVKVSKDGKMQTFE